MIKRKSLSKKARFEIFKRDGFRCMYCGAHPPSVVLHVDHIEAVANGGSSDDSNLITACEDCNLGKGATPLSAVPESLATKASLIAESEEQLRGYHSVVEERSSRIFWEAVDVVQMLTGICADIPKGWVRGVRTFVERLGAIEVREAMDKAQRIVPAHSSNIEPTFKYFCGICWSKIRELESAKALRHSRGFD